MPEPARKPRDPLRPILGVATTRSIDITVPNHGLKTGEQVRIAGVEGNTAANGTYFVTVISANVIQLRGVAGTSIYTQGGQLTRLTQFRSTLEIGNYRVFVRTKDDAGARCSAFTQIALSSPEIFFLGATSVGSRTGSSNSFRLISLKFLPDM